ncbi:MAG: hypothetical protein SYC29_12110 [Planctomycetota bacterium]|nr:hypothetical protein [Planctomycetota bacterium]
MRLLITIIAAGCLLAGSTAFGQSLSDRINHVMKQRAAAQRNNESKGRMLGVLLYTDLTVRFEDTPAREALNYLKTLLGVNIVGRYNDEGISGGIDPDTPINLDVENKPALTVLEMVLDQCAVDFEECTWQLREGYVEVGTKERLGTRRAQEVRYYPIRDLLFEPPMFDNAPELDLDSALNQGGGQGGGGGGGGGGFGGGGGGGSGGGGGGGYGGGGGSIFGDPGAEPPRITEEEKVDQIINLIYEIVEPDGWAANGGEWGSIRYYQGTLIIRAPDFMHRQIGGYPFPIRPSGSSRPTAGGIRYVTFGADHSDIDIPSPPPAAVTEVEEDDDQSAERGENES